MDSTRVISTIAGTGEEGFGGDSGRELQGQCFLIVSCDSSVDFDAKHFFPLSKKPFQSGSEHTVFSGPFGLLVGGLG